MSSKISGYRDLVVWQRAMELAEATYLLTKRFPPDEQYGLTSQARRAAASVAANIAEGYGRQTRASYVSFLRIAQGSLKELETHLILAEREALWARLEAASFLTPEERRRMAGVGGMSE